MNREVILHLSLIDRVGPGTIQTIMQSQKSDVTASDFYSFSAADWCALYGVSLRTADIIVAGLADKKMLENELALIAEHAIKWAIISEQYYPALLREIYVPPAVIYWQGSEFDDVTVKNIAVVGSRKSSSYGQKVVNNIVPELVGAGCTIVSGGALGIDAMAHDATLKSGGKTVVVLGSGLLNLYPKVNKRLFAAIREHGGIIMSAFPLNTEPKSCNFPARNRIIAGLAHGCLVVQAAQKSGSLITAHYALEQGREVFAIPGAIDDELSIGCNMLVQQGAKLVLSAQDIMNELGIERVMIQDVQKTMSHVQQQLFLDDDTTMYTEEQKAVLTMCQQPISLEDITYLLGLDVFTVQSVLFDLQLDGKVYNDMGMWKSI